MRSKYKRLWVGCTYAMIYLYAIVFAVGAGMIVGLGVREVILWLR